MKIVLIIGVALFYGVIGVYRLLWLYKKTGINPLKLKSDGSIQSINKQVFAMLILFDKITFQYRTLKRYSQALHR